MATSLSKPVAALILLACLARAQTSACPDIELVGAPKTILRSGSPDWDSGGMTPGAIVREGKRWRLVYSASRAKRPGGTDRNSQSAWEKGRIAIGSATSEDLVRWTRAPRNPILSPLAGAWDYKNVMVRAVMKDKTGYRLWYHGEGKPILPGLAVSADGLRFERHPSSPLMRVTPGGFDAEVIGDFSILPRDGVLYMFYNGYGPYDNGRHARNEKHHRIGLAISLDGVRWFKYSGNPILDLGEPGQWDSAEVLFPSVMPFRRGYLMRYMGLNKSWHQMHEGGRMRTGLAWSEDLIHWRRCANSPLGNDALFGAVFFQAGKNPKAVVGGDGKMEIYDVAIRTASAPP